MFKRTITILLVVFIAVYAWLNFEFIYSQMAYYYQALVGNDNSTDYDYQSEEITGSAYSYPISAEKKINNISVNRAGDVASKESGYVIPKTSTNLLIPSLGVTAPIIFEPTTNEDRIYSALEGGVVHYAKTPDPGNSGTAIIIGHSSVYPWYRGKYGYVFSSLSKLTEGDIINIEKEGKILTYKVTKSLIFSPTNPDDYELKELETTNGSSIVLMTCWPTGTNSKRVAVRADLVL